MVIGSFPAGSSWWLEDEERTEPVAEDTPWLKNLTEDQMRALQELAAKVDGTDAVITVSRKVNKAGDDK